MKFNIKAQGLFQKQNVEEDEEEITEIEQSYHLPATRYNISVEGQMGSHSEAQMRSNEQRSGHLFC